MENTYIYGNVPVIHSKATELVGIFHIWKNFHKRKFYLIKLTKNTSLFFPKIIISLFSLEKSSSSFFFFFFSSILQTTKLNLKWPTTIQHPWTSCLAPTMWTLASVEGDLHEVLGPKPTPST